MKTCEVVREWGDGSPNSNTYCGKPAGWRFKTRIGYKHLCEWHASFHYPYVERIPDAEPAA